MHVKKQEKSLILLENRACSVMFFVNVFALSYFQVIKPYMDYAYYLLK